ncbi:RNA polymerase sigma factor SigX [Bacillus solimangrovi]|uniref:RNA polymerase sigma factor n=1 Tax=Bacillus solimangrovi TaxID=1305675 RepID=A0A1E5LHF3_9BACI|nr:RNA polymerase sigma factor SigX [Bacillus solimangrovi]OEH93509.1 RNA polymerase sigma factor SigX [Bacillus solimangrovi]
MRDLFQHLYERYHQDLFRFIFYMVKNKEQTEDLVQEVYIRVLKSYERFEGRSSEKTWLFSIAKHVTIDWFRKQKNQSVITGIEDEIISAIIEDEDPLPEDVVILNEDIQLVYTCLHSCSEDQRMVVILRYLQSFSITETADVLGWTESKVKTTQHRAIKSLKGCMNEVHNKEGVPHV